MRSKREIVEKNCRRYRNARKSDKCKILDEFVQTTGYTRKYASWILSHWSKSIMVRFHGKVTRICVGKRKVALRSGRPRIYDAAFLAVLTRLWFLFDCLCGKRFVPMIRTILGMMIESGSFSCDESVRIKLAIVSASTVDRLLAPERKRLLPRGRSMTKPGSFLKRQIPLRTFSDWSDVIPGFVEADLVAHDGGSAYGDFLCTLTMADVATGWTEPIGVLNKAQKNVFPGLQRNRERLPFPLLGLDTDNGPEFINNHLVRYCEQEHITFTRSRPYRKNDNCFVEQKNNSVVRRAVGYSRFDSLAALETLNALYDRLRLLVNFVYPSAKLISKTRDGARVIRTFDQPRTPFQRVLAHPAIDAGVKKQLVEVYKSIDPVRIAKEFRTLQDDLIPLAAQVTNPFQQYKVFHKSAPSAPSSS